MNVIRPSNPDPAIFTVFGATGDLAGKKIIPSLWHLFRQGRLPDRLSVIGFALDRLSDDDFRALVRRAVEKKSAAALEGKAFAEFFRAFSYRAGAFEDAAAFRSLAEEIAGIESSWGVCANKLFYLAVPPPAYETIFRRMAEERLNLPCGGDLGWSRVLIEKPFGTDLPGARELQSLLASYFKEEQIYRIDHYLFKEIVQGIENFRFSNNLFETTWGNAAIGRIHIRLYESVGAEGRGNFYDGVGAFRDVGQNHLLAMLSAIAMEYPVGGGADGIQRNRADILKTLFPWTEKTIMENTFRAQYEGYRGIEGVSPDSGTETYFAVKTELAHPRWKGVPVVLEGGKRMAEARKEIVLTLKHPARCLLCETGPHAPNEIVFRLEPADEIVIRFWTKKPGFERVLEERTLSFFLYEKETKAQYVEEYAKVIRAAIAGEQGLFVSPEEIEAMWAFADPVVSGWKRNLAPLASYAPDTTPEPAIVRTGPDRKKEETMRKPGAVGMIGLGKMGANLARQLMRKGWAVAGFNKDDAATKALETDGLAGAYTLRELVEKLPRPRAVWLMVPAGNPVDETLFGEGGLAELLDEGDTVIDGGNSFYKDSAARFGKLKRAGIRFIDAGVSGGPGGALRGASIMAGGEEEAFRMWEALFADLSLPGGYRFFAGPGAGHFVKMVHNGIEYGMMQSIAEGFALMKRSDYRLDLRAVAAAYNRGSVIESRLMGWLEDGFALHGEDLAGVSGSVGRTGEGEWTVQAAREMNLKVAAIEEALNFRVASAAGPSYAGKVLSVLREQFGGHDAAEKTPRT